MSYRMQNNLYTHRLVIGDWSEDGHGRYQFIRFEASHDRPQIIAAYKKAANLASVSLCRFEGGPSHILFSDYGDSSIDANALKKLKHIGITKEALLKTDFFEAEDNGLLTTWGGEGLTTLFLMMVSSALPGFNYKLLDQDNHDCINGFWQQDFNVSIGYGVLSDG